MNEQYEKSLSKLELDKVLSLLADHASSQAAKDRCMAIRPSADADEIRHLLDIIRFVRHNADCLKKCMEFIL